MSPFRFSHRNGLTVTPINSDKTAKVTTINPHIAAIYLISLQAAADTARFGFSLSAWVSAILLG
jgi:hypothetical protein